MKRLAAAVMLSLVGLAGWVGRIALADTDPSDQPEFFFTRLAYSESPNGCCRYRSYGFRRPTMPIPRRRFVCPEFGGGNFFPPQGWGWGTDYPGGDCKFMGGIHRLTGMRVDPNPNVIGVQDPNIFKFPFVYGVEVGGMYFNELDTQQMREFFARGGFLHVDDFWGRRERLNWEQQMRKVFPDREIELLSLNHPVFHTFFDIDEIIQVPNVFGGCNGGPTWEIPDERDPRIYGISDDDGRLMVVATYNTDLGDAWEYMDERCYPEAFSGYAYRVGLNLMIYAMTH